MTLDADVLIVAKRFGCDPQLLQAVVLAEGGGDAIIRAVQCSFKDVTTREAALDILARSAVHALCDYVRERDPESFLAFWGKRWAPRGVANDPHDLNANWPGNVLKLWRPTFV